MSSVRVVTQIPGEPPVGATFHGIVASVRGIDWLVANVEAEGGRVVSVTIDGVLSSVEQVRRVAATLSGTRRGS